jgi:hypothetical protein
MQPVRTMVAVLFAAAILAAGCTAHSSTDQPSPAPPAPNLPHAPRLPVYRSGPAPVDRQGPIYAAVLRQYLTSGGGHDGGDAGFGGFRFPHIFVVDHAVAGPDTLGQGASGGPIPGAVRRAITRSLADVGPLSFMSSGEAVIVPGSCGEVRDRGILITLGPVDRVGGQVQVSVHGHVSCVGASSLTYRVERASSGWRVAGVAAWGPVS